MANCNDCICSEVCYYKAFNDERILKKRRDDVEKNCKSFVHRDSLKNAPTIDAVEVVRCRECMHWKPTGSKAGNSFSDMEYIGGCEFTNHCRRESDFCSYGERKDGDGNG